MHCYAECRRYFILCIKIHIQFPHNLMRVRKREAMNVAILYSMINVLLFRVHIEGTHFDVWNTLIASTEEDAKVSTLTTANLIMYMCIMHIMFLISLYCSS